MALPDGDRRFLEHYFQASNQDDHARYRSIFMNLPSPAARRTTLSIRRHLTETFHQGVLYWARVAMFDVTIDPLLPRAGQKLRHAAAKRLAALEPCRYPPTVL